MEEITREKEDVISESIEELIEKYQEVDKITGRYYGTQTAIAMFGEEAVERCCESLMLQDQEAVTE
jgi:hypothetical protein